MKEQLISAISGLIFTILGACLAIFFPKEIRMLDSIYIGVFAYLVTTVAIISAKVQSVESCKKIEQTAAYIMNHLKVQEAAVKDGHRAFDMFWALCLLRARQGIYKLIDHSSFTVDRDQIPKFWQQAIMTADSSWLCTNFVNLEEDWKYGWTKKGLKLQAFSIEESGVGVKRIFIYENLNEIASDLISMMHNHEEHGILCKWTTMSDDESKWAPFNKFKDEIGTVDFAIIDGSYLLAFDLSPERDNLSIRCYNDLSLIDRVTNLYTRLWEEANLVTDSHNLINKLIQKSDSSTTELIDPNTCKQNNDLSIDCSTPIT